MPPPELVHLQPPIVLPHAHEGLRIFRTACAMGNFEEVTQLTAGDHLPSREYYLREGLKAATIQKQLHIVRYLLDHGTNIDISITMAAVQTESLSVFKILAEHDWDVNMPYMGGYTALGNTILNEELARWLLDQGANPNLGPQPFNRQPLSKSIPDSGAILEIAAALSNPTFFDLLLQHGAKLENSLPLHEAAGRQTTIENDRIPMMEHLLQLGLDINGSDENEGWGAVGTPLHCAISTGAADNVKFLLTRGADVDVKSQCGLTALDLAKDLKKDEMIASFDAFSRNKRNSKISLPNSW